MSKNKFFKFFCFIFLFFFLHIHTVFAGKLGNYDKTTTIPAESFQELGQKEVIASSYKLGYFYFGQNEAVLKGRITYEQEHAFQVTS